MQVANQTRRKRKRRNNNKYRKGERRTDNDPLQSFDGDNINLDNVQDGNDNNENEGGIDGGAFDDPLAGVDDADYDDADDDGNVVNRSTAGRAKWQERHKRGKFSKKYQKKQRDQIGF